MVYVDKLDTWDTKLCVDGISNSCPNETFVYATPDTWRNVYQVMDLYNFRPRLLDSAQKPESCAQHLDLR